MAEAIDVSIKIGGTLPVTLVQAFLEAVETDVYDIIGQFNADTIKENSTGSLDIEGVCDYGQFETLPQFCFENDLSYEIHCAAVEDAEACVLYWYPGMSQPDYYITDAKKKPIIKVEDVKPLLTFMLSLIEHGQESLPMNINDESVSELVKIGLEHGQVALLKAITMEINEITLADKKDIPPFKVEEAL